MAYVAATAAIARPALISRAWSRAALSAELMFLAFALVLLTREVMRRFGSDWPRFEPDATWAIALIGGVPAALLAAAAWRSARRGPDKLASGLFGGAAAIVLTVVGLIVAWAAA